MGTARARWVGLPRAEPGAGAPDPVPLFDPIQLNSATQRGICSVSAGQFGSVVLADGGRGAFADGVEEADGAGLAVNCNRSVQPLAGLLIRRHY